MCCPDIGQDSYRRLYHFPQLLHLSWHAYTCLEDSYLALVVQQPYGHRNTYLRVV